MKSSLYGRSEQVRRWPDTTPRVLLALGWDGTPLLTGTEVEDAVLLTTAGFREEVSNLATP